MQIRKALSSKQKNEPETDATEKGTTEVDEDDRLLKEMEDLSIAMMRKKKRAKKLLAKRRAKVFWKFCYSEQFYGVVPFFV